MQMLNSFKFINMTTSGCKDIRIRKLEYLARTQFLSPVSEFNEFEPRLKFAKNWFQLSAGLNLETLDTNLSETNHI